MKLSDHLQALAKIAWEGKLRKSKIKKTDDLALPIKEVLTKIRGWRKPIDEEALRAWIATDIIEEAFKGSDADLSSMDASRTFVDYFFDHVFHGIYRGKKRPLLADEAKLRTSFSYYISQYIPRQAT